DPDARALVPGPLARRLHAVAIAVMTTSAGRTLLVAMRDPGDLSAIDELAFAAGMEIDARVVPETYLQAALELDGAPADRDRAPARAAASSSEPSPVPAHGGVGAASEPASMLRSRMPSIRPAGGTAPAVATVPVGTDPYTPSVVGRVLGYALKAAVLA